MNRETLVKASVLKIGNVVSVEGRFVKIKVDKAKNASHLLYDGETLKNVSVGSYIKIAKGFEQIVGKIEGEYIAEDRTFIPKEYRDEKEKIRRILNVSLLGFYKNGEFQRGIRELPLLDNECFLLDEIEFAEIHNFVTPKDEPLEIGSLAMEKGMSVAVGLNSLFASHIGIFGNTGSGKSYTLAKLYHELFAKFKSSEAFKRNAYFFLIDFNGEYVNGDGNQRDNVIVDERLKNIFRLSTRPDEANDNRDRYPITSEMLNDPVIWMIVLEATEKTQAPFLRRSMTSGFIEEKVSNRDDAEAFIKELILAVTTYKDRTLERALVINLLNDVNDATTSYSTGFDNPIQFFDRHLKYHNQNSEFYLEERTGTTYSSDANFRTKVENALNGIQIHVDRANPIEKIRLKVIFNYYYEIIRGYSNKEHISPLVKRLERRIDDLAKVITVKDDGLTDGAKNFTIVSLKDVNVHMRKMLPLLFCKHLYEKKKEEGCKDKFLNIIIDEAHNILSSSSQRESEQWKDYRLETFEEIIKEGRKFGVFLTLASQRPYDISQTIISQLHNYFLHRLINNKDIEAIEKTVAYLDKVSFDSLSILPTGTCVLAGLVAQIPVIVDIGIIDEKYKPFNQTIRPTQYWVDDEGGDDDFDIFT